MRQALAIGTRARQAAGVAQYHQRVGLSWSSSPAYEGYQRGQAARLHKGAMRVERLTSTCSVGGIQVGSSCGQPGDENSNIAANKWLMVAFPPLLCLTD